RVSDSPSLHPTNALTLEAWVYPTAHGDFHQVLNKWDIVGSGQKSYALQLTPDGRANFTVCADGNDAILGFINSSNSVPLNQWTHLAGIYDGTVIRLYINGVPNTQAAYSSGIFPGTHDLGIGATVGGAAVGQGGYLFAGKIDEPSLYNQALTAGEIQA